MKTTLTQDECAEMMELFDGNLQEMSKLDIIRMMLKRDCLLEIEMAKTEWLNAVLDSIQSEEILDIQRAEQAFGVLQATKEIERDRIKRLGL